MKKEAYIEGDYKIKVKKMPDHSDEIKMFRQGKGLFSRLWNLAILARLVLSGDLVIGQPSRPLSYTIQLAKERRRRL